MQLAIGVHSIRLMVGGSIPITLMTDGMQLHDGMIVVNIRADLARALGHNLVAVADQLKNAA